MIPQNPEHVEAQQATVNQNRREFFGKQTPEVQAKIKRIEEISVELESLDIPFALHANPFGWEFSKDQNDKKGYWWFGKFHRGEVGTKECAQSLLYGRDYYFSSVTGVANLTVHPDIFAALTFFDKKTMTPKTFFANGSAYSCELKS